MRPRLLVLDEPTEGIQPSIIKDIERVIRHLAGQERMAILLVEQYFEFARELADGFVKQVSDVCSVGDEMAVKVIAIDEQDRVKLSRRAAIAELDGSDSDSDSDGDGDSDD